MNKTKHKLNEKAKGIAFNEEKHLYHDGEQPYISVTTLIDKYKPKFDQTGEITKRCAEKKGISPEEQKKEWDEISQVAMRKGTDIHRYCELTALGIRTPISKEMLSDSLKMRLKAFLIMKTILSTEQIIYSKKHKIAGTIDLLTWEEGKITLYDYKTNRKEISTEEKAYDNLLGELSHIPNTQYNRYTLQMSLYRYLLELDGHSVGKMYLIHINGEINLIEVPYLKKEIEVMLND